MGAERRRRRGLSARLRLTLSYAGFLVAAGAVTLFGVYLVLRYVPDYPLTAANPSQAGAEVASRQEILEAVVGASAVILGALAVVGLAGGWLIAGRVLRPLRAIDEAARIAATGRLDHRIGHPGRYDEFGELAANFDLMLDRLDEAFLTQQRFAANASHELRTPLAVMRTMIEVARADPEATDHDQLLARLEATNDRAIGLTEALLRLGDANALNAAAEPLDLASIARRVADELALEADDRRVALVVDPRPAATHGDPALLEQLVANLTQNALRHNHADGRASLSTYVDPRTSAAVVRVENTGQVYPPEVAARLAEPFLRGAERTGRDEAESPDRGYGLGLALVARIAEIHRGTLTIDPRDGGGLVVTVALPTRAR